MKKLGYIKKELTKLYGKEVTDTITTLAQKHYENCLLLCKDASAGELTHLENTILPTVSFYKALLETDKENAYQHTYAIIVSLCKKGAAVLNTALKLPGMKSLFMKLLPKMAVSMFGRDCGFDYENDKATKRILQMDMTVCPYVKYAKLFGVEELTAVFCESDFATYGSMPGIAFERTQTLGTGGHKCDFKFSRID